ncbi:hypothetical protein [Lysobacter antibioticus]|nr:hypothetical protein [Lysobacter antibioticus]
MSAPKFTPEVADVVLEQMSQDMRSYGAGFMRVTSHDGHVDICAIPASDVFLGIDSAKTLGEA